MYPVGARPYMLPLNHSPSYQRSKVRVSKYKQIHRNGAVIKVALVCSCFEIDKRVRALLLFSRIRRVYPLEGRKNRMPIDVAALRHLVSLVEDLSL